MFDVEYWSLEQAKLGKEPEQPLAGQVALVTGAAGAIGDATARALAGAGAEIAVLDLDEERVRALAVDIGAAAVALPRDATDRGRVRAGSDAAVAGLGGVDLRAS